MDKYICDFINNEIKLGRIAGANICVMKENKEVYYREFGLADIDRKIPVKRDTIFRMYSMSKPVTAAAVMLLFERGMIDLYDPVSKYLTTFQKPKVLTEKGLVDAKREVTIQDLLNMTSGVVYPDDNIPAGIKMKEIFDRCTDKALQGKPMSTVEFILEVGKCPLAFHPGDQWRYGSSADVLGALIEVVSGKRFGEFLKEEFFEPLGMVDTGFYVPEEKWNRFAENYEYSEEEKKLFPYRGYNLALVDFKKQPGFESGGAGLVSTIEDYKKFALMLLNDGIYEGKRYLGRKTIEFMRMNQLTKEQLKSYDWDNLRGYGYGNLMRVLQNPALAATNASVGEYGWDGWTGNYFTIDPVEKLVFLYFFQRCGAGTSDTRKLRAMAFAALDEWNTGE